MPKNEENTKTFVTKQPDPLEEAETEAAEVEVKPATEEREEVKRGVGGQFELVGGKRYRVK